jgi:hypothetical protein
LVDSLGNVLDVFVDALGNVLQTVGGRSRDPVLIVAVSVRLGRLRIGHDLTMSGQHAQVVGSVGVATFVGTREGFFSLGEPILAGEEYPEFERAVGVASVVGAAICRCCTSEIAALFEQQA